MKKMLLCLFVFIQVNSLKAQTETINGISFFYPGYLHERPITDQITTRVLLAMMTQFKTSAEADLGRNIYFSGLKSILPLPNSSGRDSARPVLISISSVPSDHDPAKAALL